MYTFKTFIERTLEIFPYAYSKPWVRASTLTVYYLFILIGLILLYGRGDFSTPAFIYQGF